VQHLFAEDRWQLFAGEPEAVEMFNNLPEARAAGLLGAVFRGRDARNPASSDNAHTGCALISRKESHRVEPGKRTSTSARAFAPLYKSSR
jgi:hypothetical protein